MNAVAYQSSSTGESPYANRSVLVLEDNEFQRVALIQVLRSLGVTQVTEAGSVGEAVSLIEGAAGGFDVALCDLQLGDEAGVQFIEQAGGKVRSFIIVSALNMMDMLVARRKALQHGERVAAVLAKPISKQNLQAALDRAMQELDRGR
jgi:CheY-like chemotaxis protein